MFNQAEELNCLLKKESALAFDLLSERGRSVYFPKSGILRQTAEAKGKKINATIGIALEDDARPMVLSGPAKKISLPANEIFTYAPGFGVQELRDAWKKNIFKKNPSLSAEISFPVVTNGITHALALAGYMFVNENDKIIIADKFWGNYKLIFENNYHCEFATYNTFFDNKFDVLSFKNKLNEFTGKKIVLLNFPNNPSGYSLTTQEAQQIEQIILQDAQQGNELVIILDDAYFGLFYENDIYKESLFSKLANLHENVLAVKLDGASKEDFFWGLRVGFITFGSKAMSKKAYEILEQKIAGAIRSCISNCSNLAQNLLLQTLTDPNYDREKKEKFEILKQRYLKVKQILTAEKYKKYFKPLPFNSGYFMCLQLADFLDAEAIRKKLLGKFDTGVVSIGNLLRIAFSSVPQNDLEQLFENIYQACFEENDQKN